MIIHYLKIAWRNLLKNRTQSIINVAGLSIGLTCAAIALLYVDYESTFDSHHLKADRIYRVVERMKYADEDYYTSSTAFPLAKALRNDFQEFELITQTCGPVVRVIQADHENRFKEEGVLFADPEFLRVFDHLWIAGAREYALQETSSVVLTASLATKYFNDLSPHQVVGKEIVMDGTERLTVTGVIEDPPANSTLRYNMIIPFGLFAKLDPYRANNWSGNYNGTTFVMVQPDADTKPVETRIDRWKSKYLNAEDDQRKTYYLQPLKQMHTDTRYISAPGSYTIDRKYLVAVQIVGLFILTLACINFINLTTAYASNRFKEVGIRKTLGGVRSQIIAQFMAENLLLSTIAVLISLTSIQYLLGIINDHLEVLHIYLEIGVQEVVQIIGLGLLISIIAAIYPSVVMSAYRPAFALRPIKSSGRSLRLRKLLVVFQFTIVQVMIIGTIVVALQMQYIREKDLGFTKDQIVTMPVPDYREGHHLGQRLLSNPEVIDFTFGSDPPTSTFRSFGTNARLPHQSEQEGVATEMKCVDANFIPFYALKLIAGSNFTHTGERFDQFIVNEELIRKFGWTAEEAIGEKLAINEGVAEIVGVVKNFHNNSLQEQITPCVLMNWELLFETAHVKYNAPVTGGSDMIPLLNEQWNAAYPDGVFEYTFLNDFLQADYLYENLIYTGFTVFAAISMFIGCMGMFGMMQFIALQRTKEIGIRKILGAKIVQLVGLLVNENFWLVVAAFVLACPLGYYLMEEWLTDFAYHIRMSWVIFAMAGTATLLITAGTIAFRILKTANTNPVEALRYE